MLNQAVGALKGATEPIIMGNLVPDMDPELYGPKPYKILIMTIGFLHRNCNWQYYFQEFQHYCFKPQK